jgi:hypothetical protein
VKVAPKHIHARNDCFAATERGNEVRIEAFRNVVLIQANGVEHEMSLSAFADMMEDAITKDITRVTGNPSIRVLSRIADFRMQLAEANRKLAVAQKQAAMDSECIDRCQREGAKVEAENERLRAEVAALRQDKELLSELEAMSGVALVSDDFGHWAVTGSGFQSVPENPPDDVQTTFFIKKSEWKQTVRQAIDAARTHPEP